MKRNISIFAAIILCLVFIFSIKSYALDTASDFSMNDLNNKTISLSQFKDKQPVILIFWTTWCPFCREQLDILKDKYAQLKQDGVEVFAIDVGEKPAKVESFVKNRNLPFSVLLDQNTSVAKNYEVYGVPTYIFIDKAGKIVLREIKFPDYRNIFGIKNPTKNGQ